VAFTDMSSTCSVEGLRDRVVGFACLGFED
jgi:hypothetical protein